MWKPKQALKVTSQGKKLYQYENTRSLDYGNLEGKTRRLLELWESMYSSERWEYMGSTDLEQQQKWQTSPMTVLLAVTKSWCFMGRGRTGACQTHSTTGNTDGFCLQLICYLAVQLPLPYGVAWYITTHVRPCALLLPKVNCRLRKHTPRGLITPPLQFAKRCMKAMRKEGRDAR